MSRKRHYLGSAKLRGAIPDGPAPAFPKAPRVNTVRRFTVPAGTPCTIRNVLRSGDEWRPYTTKVEIGFDRFGRWHKDETGSYYEFRSGVWVMLVRSSLVKQW